MTKDTPRGQPTKLPRRAERHRHTKAYIVPTPRGPRAWASKGKIKTNKAAKLRRLRKIINGSERCIARIREALAEREKKAPPKQYARKARKVRGR